MAEKIIERGDGPRRMVFISHIFADAWKLVEDPVLSPGVPSKVFRVGGKLPGPRGPFVDVFELKDPRAAPTPPLVELQLPSWAFGA
jgi:hypothetical protein